MSIGNRNRVFFATAITLLCTGCPSESSAVDDATDAGETVEAVDDADAALLEGIDLSGEDAAEEITADNADAEFEKLLEEIEKDG